MSEAPSTVPVSCPVCGDRGIFVTAPEEARFCDCAAGQEKLALIVSTIGTSLVGVNNLPIVVPTYTYDDIM